MESDKRQNGGAALPYVNNILSVIFVVAINLAIMLPTTLGKPITRYTVLIESSICGAVSSFFCVFITYFAMRKRRAQGLLPSNGVDSALMRKLPRKPLPLSLIFAVASMLVLPLIAEVVMRFFGIVEYEFHRFLAWKIVYSCLVSVKLTELSVLRYSQSDCQTANDPPQTGAGAIKNPLPRAKMFVDLFNTVTTDFGFNLLIGLISGITTVVDQVVMIAAVKRSGIVVSAAILGLIVTFRMVLPAVKSIRALRDSGGLPPLKKRNPLLSRLPDRPFAFAMAYAPLLMIVSSVVMYAVFTFFGFEKLSFFQYFVMRTIYVSIIRRPVVALAVARYRQPRANAAQIGQAAEAVKT